MHDPYLPPADLLCPLWKKGAADHRTLVAVMYKAWRIESKRFTFSPLPSRSISSLPPGDWPASDWLAEQLVDFRIGARSISNREKSTLVKENNLITWAVNKRHYLGWNIVHVKMIASNPRPCTGKQEIHWIRGVDCQGASDNITGKWRLSKFKALWKKARWLI